EDFKVQLKTSYKTLLAQAKTDLSAETIKSEAEATLKQAIQEATRLNQASEALQVDLKHSRQAIYWGYALTFLGGVVITACLMWLCFIPK
ncbi:hypothetical protein Lpp48_00060, partial [Lacticaseibacillus paracasei subsp. paracasei Lpp48]